MMEKHGIIALVDADIAGIGNKARHLARLLKCQPELFAVPSGVVLLPTFSLDKDMACLHQTLSDMGEGLYAVRSCGLDEDGDHESMAGKFDTMLGVPACDLKQAIAQVRSSFTDVADTGSVLIQHMVNPDYAGVMFTQSIENAGLASCEFSLGVAEDLVSGKVKPTHVDYGRLSGALYPEQNQHQSMLDVLFLVGMTIEILMDEPQDVEWAYDAKHGQLYVLQSRRITTKLYDESLATEQQRVASITNHLKPLRQGQVLFEDSAVREVVSAPTRLTQGLMQQLYAPKGALGAALQMLNIPCPQVEQAYVLSVFGRLYANVYIGKQLFGYAGALPFAKRLWANYRLQRRMKHEPDKLLRWLKGRIEALPDGDDVVSCQADNVLLQAQHVVALMQTFVDDVYPIAYAATILAQMAGENDGQASLTSHFISDLSRLHHTGEMQDFMEKWGLRSEHDYELSAPRFCEDDAHTMRYAAQFADVAWDKQVLGEGFLFYKELAKDKVVRCLYPVRQSLLQLGNMLGLGDGHVFQLDILDIKALAKGELIAKDMLERHHQRVLEEVAFAQVQLGSKVTLGDVEQLAGKDRENKGLRGKMVSVGQAFQGRIRHVNKLADAPLAKGDIILSPYLEPKLVGYFQQSLGCICEVGGALSHAAIVAREKTYPVLVLAGSSEVMRDGDFVAVDEVGRVTLTRQLNP